VARREENEEELKEAQEAEVQEDINKYTRRLVHVTKEHNDDVKRLLRLMGQPVVEAPGEAEAQCAVLCKSDKVFATATEDMDALTFGSKKLLRHLTFSAARKLPIVEVDVQIVLEDLGLTMDEFIDLCILCGCDYTCTIKGIGPGRSIEMIKKHRSIEQAVKFLDPAKHAISPEFQFKEAAQLFRTPDCTPPDDVKLEWKPADEEGIIQFLVTEKGFNKERIESGLKRIKQAKGKGTQQRMETFFGAVAVVRHEKKPDPKASGKKGAKGAAAKTAAAAKNKSGKSTLSGPAAKKLKK